MRTHMHTHTHTHTHTLPPGTTNALGVRSSMTANSHCACAEVVWITGDEEGSAMSTESQCRCESVKGKEGCTWSKLNISRTWTLRTAPCMHSMHIGTLALDAHCMHSMHALDALDAHCMHLMHSMHIDTLALRTLALRTAPCMHSMACKRRPACAQADRGSTHLHVAHVLEHAAPLPLRCGLGHAQAHSLHCRHVRVPWGQQAPVGSRLCQRLRVWGGNRR